MHQFIEAMRDHAISAGYHRKSNKELNTQLQGVRSWYDSHSYKGVHRILLKRIMMLSWTRHKIVLSLKTNC